jgi:hypothetical protein
MARVGTTRKSISVQAEAGGRIKAYTEERGVSNASFVESLVEERLGAPTDKEREAYEGDQKKPKTGQERKGESTDKKSPPSKEPDGMDGYTPPIQSW